MVATDGASGRLSFTFLSPRFHDASRTSVVNDVAVVGGFTRQQQNKFLYLFSSAILWVDSNVFPFHSDCQISERKLHTAMIYDSKNSNREES